MPKQGTIYSVKEFARQRETYGEVELIRHRTNNHAESGSACH